MVCRWVLFVAVCWLFCVCLFLGLPLWCGTVLCLCECVLDLHLSGFGLDCVRLSEFGGGWGEGLIFFVDF